MIEIAGSIISFIVIIISACFLIPLIFNKTVFTLLGCLIGSLVLMGICGYMLFNPNSTIAQIFTGVLCFFGMIIYLCSFIQGKPIHKKTIKKKIDFTPLNPLDK